MDISQALKDIETLSHAYALEGALGEHEALLAHLLTLGFDTVGNPDAFVRVHEQFGIDESREVIRHATRRPLRSARSMFVITTPTMTAEAQHALLKTFEEPSAPVTFFLIVPSVETLLPTLRSRLQLISTAPTEGHREQEVVSAKEFLFAGPAARIKLLAPLLEERRAGDTIQFLASLEKRLAPRIADGAMREGLRAVYRARTYAGDKGALLKVLLEQVALLAPRLQ